MDQVTIVKLTEDELRPTDLSSLESTNGSGSETTSPGPAPGSGPGPSVTSPPTPRDAGNQMTVGIRRRPIPRKGHTKSRRGCYNCKTRKVKCQENLPVCFNCTRIGLVCEYPEPAQSLVRRPVQPMPAPKPALNATSVSSLFTADDMRFFHHFVVTAYPPLPIKRDDIWKGVAAISHQYDYLIHAMLGMAASHLSLYGADYKAEALSHRVQAIQALNRSIASPCKSRIEGEARFAAILSLTFQASCMPEGMIEFLSMIRGCHIIAAFSMQSFEASAWASFSTQGYTDSIRKLIGPGALDFAPRDAALFDEFIASLRALGPLCSSPLEIRFLAATERVINLTKTCVVESFAQFTALYDIISGCSNDEFAAFTAPTNYSAQLLAIHFVLIEFAIGELALGDAGERFAFRRRACVAWVNHLDSILPNQYQRYLEWPKKYREIMKNMHPSILS